jgi:hypothetical protein
MGILFVCFVALTAWICAGLAFSALGEPDAGRLRDEVLMFPAVIVLTVVMATWEMCGGKAWKAPQYRWPTDPKATCSRRTRRIRGHRSVRYWNV